MQLDETARLEREIDQEVRRLKATFSDGASLAQCLTRPGTSYGDLPGGRDDLHPDAVKQVEITLRYEGYIEREQAQIAKAGKLEAVRIPSRIDYLEIDALRYEARQKLNQIQPETLGQASRISGVNPADISILSVWIKRGNGRLQES